MHDRKPRGLFAGLATLDVVNRVALLPTQNQKVTAERQFIAAGGPAANAAVTFAALGGHATLLTALGAGPIAHAIRAELEGCGVNVIDIAPELSNIAPVSSVMVITASGDRSVIGSDAASVGLPPRSILLAKSVAAQLITESDVVLLDGHHPELAQIIARNLADLETPSVLDAGRWKPVMQALIPRVSDVVASADFRTPGAQTVTQTMETITRWGAKTVAVTAGGGPVIWQSNESRGEASVRKVNAVDTLGAGDVFHGAYAFARAIGADMDSRIAYANEVAATRCGYLGPRSWLRAVAEVSKPY